MVNIYRHTYRNARDVLPEELIIKIQEHHYGLLWIPVTHRRRIKSRGLEERNQLILDLRERGDSVREISGKVYLSPERVAQIIREGRVVIRPSSENPEGVAEVERPHHPAEAGTTGEKSDGAEYEQS